MGITGLLKAPLLKYTRVLSTFKYCVAIRLDRQAIKDSYTNRASKGNDWAYKSAGAGIGGGHSRDAGREGSGHSGGR